MKHAFECLGDCPDCRGRGRRRGRRGVCTTCGGSGLCEHEWRDEIPGPAAPCRERDCCRCSRTPCLAPWCARCFYVDPHTGAVREAHEWPCTSGACPACGGVYVAWLSHDVAPEDVWLGREVPVRGQPPTPGVTRPVPSRAEVRRLVTCLGGCGRTEPVLQDGAGGQRRRVGAFVCGDCHVRLCGDHARSGWHSGPCAARELQERQHG